VEYTAVSIGKYSNTVTCRFSVTVRYGMLKVVGGVGQRFSKGADGVAHSKDVIVDSAAEFGAQSQVPAVAVDTWQKFTLALYPREGNVFEMSTQASWAGRFTVSMSWCRTGNFPATSVCVAGRGGCQRCGTLKTGCSVCDSGLYLDSGVCVTGCRDGAIATASTDTTSGGACNYAVEPEYPDDLIPVTTSVHVSGWFSMVAVMHRLC